MLQIMQYRQQQQQQNKMMSMQERQFSLEKEKYENEKLKLKRGEDKEKFDMIKNLMSMYKDTKDSVFADLAHEAMKSWSGGKGLIKTEQVPIGSAENPEDVPMMEQKVYPKTESQRGLETKQSESDIQLNREKAFALYKSGLPDADKPPNEYSDFRKGYLTEHPNANLIDIHKAYKASGRKDMEDVLTKYQQAQIGHQLRGELRQNPYVKSFQDLNGKFSVMQKALEKSTKTNNFVAIDQALINLYNRIMEPTSVTRESEYLRTPNNLSIINRFQGAVSKFGAGGAGIAQQDRQALVDMAKEFYDSYAENYNQTVSDYEQTAKDSGVNPQSIGVPFRRAKKEEKTIQKRNPGESISDFLKRTGQ